MNNSEQRRTCAKVRAWDMVDYLSGLGHNPTKIKGIDYWYLPLLRNERTASFKVNRKLNRWYGHGISKGGNLIDFAILYQNCSVVKLLKNISINFSFHPLSFHQPPSVRKENKIQVLNEFSISSVSLLNYLKQRHIPYEIADGYCKEVRYKFKEKIYSAIGFKNDSGGYELRNKYFKNTSAPKSITTVKNGCKKIAVFESLFDFLSFLVLNQNEKQFQFDFCILNSLSFFSKSRPFLEQYISIHLFPDNDKTGQNCSFAALKLDKKYVDQKGLYAGYKDLNEWLIATTNGNQTTLKSIPP